MYLMNDFVIINNILYITSQCIHISEIYVYLLIQYNYI